MKSKMSASWCLSKCFYFRFGLKPYKSLGLHQLSTLNCTRNLSSVASENTKHTKQYDVVRYTVSTKPGDKKDTNTELPSTYSPQYVEAAWYDWWVQQGYFLPKARSGSSEKFVICLPPPNVTGTLHLGHALTCSIQDAVVRWNRMHGRETVWIPGCDHAGIATQVVVEKQLWKDERKTRHDVGREEFLKRVWKWKHSKGGRIYDQMRKLGASLDWSRTCFTMDDPMSEAVREAFIRLHEEGMIYRNSRLVHWCCHLRSTISDIEVINQQIDTPTYLKIPGYEKPIKFGEMQSFAYPVSGSDEEVTVSTTRLETMLGDTAVAVHPDDCRYSHLHGAHLQHPFDGRLIPIVTDESVDRDFGTGAVKITPAHDHNDYSIGVKNNLPSINIIDDQGTMENVPESFLGLRRFDARRKVEKLLQEKGLYRGKQPHAMVLPMCQRSNDVIEPRVKDQWYVKCDEMAANALHAVNSGALTFIPDFHRKIWHEFLGDEKSRDWCISRQIWWGHRIPAYKVNLRMKKEVKEELWVSAHSEEEACLKAEQKLGLSREDFFLQQDEDVLDTWFSSALFPFSTLGWPKQTADFRNYYPNSLLETGSDILFFWVARMIMLGYKMTGHLPFSKVLLHGTLRDARGRKMSKSLGNVIDPMDVIYGVSLQELHNQVEQFNFDGKEVEIAKAGQKKDFPDGIQECGTDALRFALCSYQFKDPEIRMNISHVQSYRHFCNKIWQAFRFIQQNLGQEFTPSTDFQTEGCLKAITPVDEWILSRLSHMVHQCDYHFNTYDLQFVTQALYNFWWNDLCAVYLEYSKTVLDPEDCDSVKNILYFCTDTFLRALSPVMPYLTEELYQRLVAGYLRKAESICVAEYPLPSKYPWYNETVDTEMELVKSVCSGTLSLIKTFQLSPKTVDVYIQASKEDSQSFDAYKPVFTTQLRTRSVTVLYEDESPSGCLKREITPAVNVFVKVQDIKQISCQFDKLKESKTKTLEKIDSLETKHARKKPDVQDKIDKLKVKVTSIDEQIQMINQLRS